MPGVRPCQPLRSHGPESLFISDIPTTVLSDARLRECCFILADGSKVLIPAEDLRRVLLGGREHYQGKIWGPFNINPLRATIEGQKVQIRTL